MSWISKYKTFGNSRDKKLQWLSAITAATAIIAVTGITAMMAETIGQNGWGIREGESISITTERDAEGNIVKTVETITPEPGKTGWDWLNLVGVPLSLLILGFLFQWQQQKRADEEAKEEALQVYLDRLSAILVDKNILAIAVKVNKSEQQKSTQPKDDVTVEQQELLNTSVDVIRARTLSILRRFEKDLERKSHVIRFLSDAEIISKTKLNLSGTDLSGVDLRKTNLKGANLSGANLSGANLCLADLRGAKLNRVNFSGVAFVKANLSGTKLQGVNLSGANLTDADLSFADLSFTNLGDADTALMADASLRAMQILGAYPMSAKSSNRTTHYGKADLRHALLCYTKLPNSINLDPNRDCQALGIDSETGEHLA